MDYTVDGYISDSHVSYDYKVIYLARMLAGYDDETWNRLKEGRQYTYMRAATTLLFDHEAIMAKIAEWNTRVSIGVGEGEKVSETKS